LAETDEELIRRFNRTREDAAFMQLMERYLPRMRRLLCLILSGTAEDREDAEQEILVALYGDLPRFRFHSAFGTYFYRYCRNKAVDLIRRNERERRRFRAMKLHVRTQPAFEPSAEKLYLDGETNEEVIDAVMSLPVGERALIFLKDSEGLSIREIADILSIPEGTVKSRLHRARDRAVAQLQARRNTGARPSRQRGVK
jgi:RNA polymerase sigma-70 factor (ECF subfamily)